MFGKTYVRDLIGRSAENETDRRRFLKTAGVAGLGVVGAGVLSGIPGGAADAASGPSDSAILNFALNLEYLEAQFYSHAVHGHGIDASLLTGHHTQGHVTGGRKVTFSSKRIGQFAREIADDELAHVKFIRTALGSARVSQPNINLTTSFTAAAMAAGLITTGQTFDPFASEGNFLLAAFIFEDVGVTAYKGAAPLINNKTYLDAAAGILAVEAYHAAGVRLALADRGLEQASVQISNARDSLDGKADRDQGIRHHERINITPASANGIAYGRSASEVLNIVYLSPKKVSKGGFFPSGVHGTIHYSKDNA